MRPGKGIVKNQKNNFVTVFRAKWELTLPSGVCELVVSGDRQREERKKKIPLPSGGWGECLGLGSWSWEPRIPLSAERGSCGGEPSSEEP